MSELEVEVDLNVELIVTVKEFTDIDEDGEVFTEFRPTKVVVLMPLTIERDRIDAPNDDTFVRDRIFDAVDGPWDLPWSELPEWFQVQS